MSPPTECKAITVHKIGHASITTVPLPQLRPAYILVRVLAVALNPTDHKAIDGKMGGDDGALRGCRPGCDYVGVVEAVGAAVTKPLRPGDRVAGVAHGCNQGVPEDGAFAEWIVAKGDLAILVPDGVKDVEAATLGIGVTTVGQGLYQELKLPLPTEPSPTPIPVLIHGGSTATGILGIQFAKASGCKVVTTCSPRNIDYVGSLGADVVFDYNEFSTPEKFSERVRREVGDELTLAWDCVGSEDSARLCVSAMSREKGGQYRSLLGVDAKVIEGVNPKVQSGVTLAYFVFGEEFRKWGPFPAKPADFEFGKMFWEMTRGLLAEGKVKAARQDVNRGGKGLEGVLVGLQEMREGKVSGVKLVYTL
ncbi:GroES-like protein [Coniochaeta ligniaria NRRL 30616]|uniref:GroES-like protein n=1 Tax=Coniochaeta ligniaria NRRL 30616 TaxID=1408157 RepID=A0A1J7JNY1_9PEZI|nr:GroES-like protein [Coniochaeta ligniaria NRRL 30616]